MLRFATSPVGDMLISELRIAIINYLIAQQRKEGFIIRIDDTDKASNREGKDTEIMQILEKFALLHTSVFHQSKHLHMHQTLAIRLLKEAKAFVCVCSNAQTEADKEKSKSSETNDICHGKCSDTAYDVKILKEEKTPFVMRIHAPKERMNIHDISDFIILNADGTPTPTFASACDDMLSGIDMLIHDEAHLVDTARQIHIKKQLGFDAKIEYAHLPTISYNDDNPTVKWLFEQGFIPDAIINYLLLLGNTNTPQEIFTLPEAIAWFKLENITDTKTLFNLEKLRHINREHLRRIDDKQLSTLFGFADAKVGQLVKLYLTEASTINELALKIRPIFAPKEIAGKYKNQMHLLQTIIADAPMIDNFNDFTRYLSKVSGLDKEVLTQPLRYLLTGAEHGPELSDIYPLIKSYLLEITS